jgi:hypothetical protein
MIELSQASAQLTCMQRTLIDHEPDLIADALRKVPCGTSNEPEPPYPFFDTFALIGSDGRQEVKAAPGPRVSNALSVADRQYFDAVQKGRAWRGVPVCPDGCFIESVRSWTTGEQRAVLSAPTGNRARPVAALTIPLRSLIDVVTPVGFEYAVIDENHKVLFHSDPERNGYENFVIETDRDRRLRAVVAARSAGALNVNYWGRAHRAYVQPSIVPHWSIVALHDKEATRGLNVEATALTALFLAVYMTVWLAAVLAALRMGATWLWPDPQRSTGYRALACIYLPLLALFGILAYRGDTTALLWAGFIVPAVGWMFAPAVLNWRGSATNNGGRRPNPLAEYALMGSLLLVLSGVVPAAAFTARAHDLNLESYVKHRQLELARTLAGRSRGLVCEQQGHRRADWAAGIDEYFDFFYDTRLACTSDDEDHEEPAHHRGDALVAFLEDYMPYYGEYSVGMRELLHARAGDGSWTSRHTGDGRLQLTMPALTASSVVPAFRSMVNPGKPDTSSRIDLLHHERAVQFVPVFLAVVALALGFLARGFVAFALWHVFLSHVGEPLRASGRAARRQAPPPTPVDVAVQMPRTGWLCRVRFTPESLLVHEGRPSAFLKRLCDDIQLSPLYRAGEVTRDQILDEIEERASGYYRRLWNACSDDEKLVIGHVAQQGLANAASRRVVRRLLTRGLLSKDPALRLMNETFTRFVLSRTCRADVALLEGEAEPSTWDRLRAPLAFAAVSAGVFLFMTQREMFDSTLTTVAGVTAAVPTVFRLASLVMDRRPGPPQEAKA